MNPTGHLDQWADAERDVLGSLRNAKAAKVSCLIDLFDGALTVIRAQQGKPPLDGAYPAPWSGAHWQQMETYERAVYRALEQESPQAYGLCTCAKESLLKRSEARIELYRSVQEEASRPLLQDPATNSVQQLPSGELINPP